MHDISVHFDFWEKFLILWGVIFHLKTSRGDPIDFLGIEKLTVFFFQNSLKFINVRTNPLQKYIFFKNFISKIFLNELTKSNSRIVLKKQHYKNITYFYLDVINFKVWFGGGIDWVFSFLDFSSSLSNNFRKRKNMTMIIPPNINVCGFRRKLNLERRAIFLTKWLFIID